MKHRINAHFLLLNMGVKKETRKNQKQDAHVWFYWVGMGIESNLNKGVDIFRSNARYSGRYVGVRAAFLRRLLLFDGEHRRYGGVMRLGLVQQQSDAFCR